MTKDKLLHLSAFVFIILITLYFRLFSLGFSDYQGDEGKALYTQSISNIPTYLLEQRKGPIQFMTTYMLSLADPTYSNHFATRLPFAISSIVSVVFLYLVAKLHFGKKAALFASIIFALNGVFIAFGRIVQYQSFVIMFSLLSVYFFSLLNFQKKWQPAGLYYGGVFWALGILSHYDAIFICPIVLYLVAGWFFAEIDKKKACKHILLASVLPLILCGIFYVPFVLNLSQSTSNYWLGRISGGDEKISSSLYTFTLYNQGWMLIFYALFSAFFTVFALLNIKSKKVLYSIMPFILWFLFPFVFMELFVNVPGTHFYTYLIPLFMLFGIGLAFISNQKYLRIPVYVIFILFTFWHLYVQHMVFIDTTHMYPWENEKIGPLNLTVPDKKYHLSLFGFPYSGYWKFTSDYVYRLHSRGTYGTNEKDTISSIYMSYRYGSDPKYYIHVETSQKIPGNVPTRLRDKVRQGKKLVSYNECTLNDYLNKGTTQFVNEKILGNITPFGCTGDVSATVYQLK